MAKPSTSKNRARALARSQHNNANRQATTAQQRRTARRKAARTKE